MNLHPFGDLNLCWCREDFDCDRIANCIGIDVSNNRDATEMINFRIDRDRWKFFDSEIDDEWGDSNSVSLHPLLMQSSEKY